MSKKHLARDRERPIISRNDKDNGVATKGKPTTVSVNQSTCMFPSLVNACNVKNRTVFCDDNLDVMQGINTACIDLIYLDPPFNKNKEFTAPIGSSAVGASFKDIFRQEDLKDEWLQTIQEDAPELFHYLSGIKGIGKPYNFAYLAYMAIRLIECRRVLKRTGSIYLHCDPTMSHYLKTTMDCIFGEKNFRNEIVWSYRRWPSRSRRFQTMHDILLFYARGSEHTFNIDYEPASESYLKRFKGKTQILDPDSKTRKIPVDAPTKGMPLRAVWEISFIAPVSRERVGYPTQKPLALLDRIIKASSNEGDMVLDPFCGCATTCVAAERLQRQWIGVDISIKAHELVRQRLAQEVADPEDLLKCRNVIHLQTDPPTRTDRATGHRETKYVYVISHPNYPGEYKVGIARDWKSRLNAYQTSEPERQYKLAYQLETPWFRETERYIHSKFPNKHEWVTGDLDEIVAAINHYQP